VWDATLELLHRRLIPFQAWRVRKRAGLGRENDRTIRRTLAVMEGAGWLEHEHNSKWWHPGPKAEERFHG
jgi:DNA-binding IclR family transcriptional regulator